MRQRLLADQPTRAERDFGVRAGLVVGLALGSWAQPSPLVCSLWAMLVALVFIRDVRRDIEAAPPTMDAERWRIGADFKARPVDAIMPEHELPELPPRERWH